MLKPKYKLSPLAEKDLLQINTSTIKLWGSQQARSYSLKIESSLLKLTQYPDIGLNRDDLYPDAKSFPVEKHIIYYCINENGIGISRILHQRMEPSIHFKVEE